MGRFGLILLVLSVFALAESRHLRYIRRRRAASHDENERREVCIDELGCYAENNPVVEESWLPRWASMESLNDAMESNALRDTREDVGTQFRWWAPLSTEAEIFTNIYLEDKSKLEDLKGKFDPKLKVKFIIHGFMGGEAKWALDMKDALMRKEQCNVFIVDWTNGAARMYPSAVANTRVVGAELGHFIVQLVSSLGVKLEDIHVIGHSLGAHTAGYAGKWVKSRLENIIGRITGLDPAGVNFKGQIAGERLDQEDASFVDVIHTNWAGDYSVSGLGLFEAVGHFDFYPNGGEIQPGCMSQSEVFYSFNVDTAVDDFSCSHSRAIELFIESIESESCQFLADQCTSWGDYVEGKCKVEGTLTVEMGYNADKYKQSVDPYDHMSFYLNTNGNSPYCIAK